MGKGERGEKKGLGLHPRNEKRRQEKRQGGGGELGDCFRSEEEEEEREMILARNGRGGGGKGREGQKRGMLEPLQKGKMGKLKQKTGRQQDP